MPYTSSIFHLVFATKERHPWVVTDLDPRLHAYVRGIVRNLDGTCLEIGSFDDHMHIVSEIPPKCAVASFIGKIKANSSRFAHDVLGIPKHEGWQDGYGAFSVSRSNLDAVARYVRNQREHHRRFDFDEELRCLLERHGIELKAP